MIDCRIELLPPSKKYYIGVSGGVDSIVLCRLLSYKLPNLEIAHVNHHLTKDNNAMEEVVRSFGEKMGIPVTVFKGVPYEDDGTSSEVFARNVRVSFWKELNGHLILGHHFDDAVESHLMNFFRGQEEYMPIPLMSKFRNCTVIRPNLLSVKASMYEYAEKNGLMQFVYEDPTNKCSAHAVRNKIRNDILPFHNASGMRNKLRRRIEEAYLNGGMYLT